MRIEQVNAQTISDTRGRPTIETTIFGNGHKIIVSVPSGKSTGKHEAKELRDEDGGVETAIKNVTGEIADAITKRDFATLAEFDAFVCNMDGTENKSRLGANAILSVSMAAARLFAEDAKIPLWRFIANTAGTTPHAPRLFVNVMNGGAHADFRLPIQEHILVVGEETMKQSVATAKKAFIELGDALRVKQPDIQMGDEGGYAPTFDVIEQSFEFLTDIVSKHSNTSIAIDSAANELRGEDGTYTLFGKRYSSVELQDLYARLIEQFPFHAIEDPFAEDDIESFASITAALGKRVIIIGDDITVTNPVRIEDAIKHQYINAVLIKPNQIGTVSETLDSVKKTYSAGLSTVVSHRSGETYDTFIADLAYGIGAHGIKAGGLAQPQRLAKYERLNVIEQEATILPI